ncbi:unnamed protein product [Linum trigynum]|uniref:Uncharacterized protein n=1 Tax=Linum trigynum TaxID=586398 RepID=A0AAV2CV05_9ROSI
MAEQPQQLVFIPFPSVGHLVSMVELAKLLVHRHSTLVVSIPVITSLSTAAAVTRYTDSLAAPDSDLNPRVKLLHLANDDDPSAPAGSVLALIQSQKPRVTEAVSAELTRSGGRLAGFVHDIFCTSMLDVAERLGLIKHNQEALKDC